MKKILLLLSAINLSTHIFSQHETKFEGHWCNDEQAEETGEYLSLSIFRDESGKHGSSFSSGGPFEETHTVKLISENKIELYFESVGGSIAFNELQHDSGAKCKKSRLAELEFLDENHIKISIFPNECSYLPNGQAIILTKLKEDQFCGDF